MSELTEIAEAPPLIPAPPLIIRQIVEPFHARDWWKFTTSDGATYATKDVALMVDVHRFEAQRMGVDIAAKEGWYFYEPRAVTPTGIIVPPDPNEGPPPPIIPLRCTCVHGRWVPHGAYTQKCLRCLAVRPTYGHLR